MGISKATYQKTRFGNKIMDINKIIVLGDGGWGTALSILLSKKNFSVTLWSVSSGYAKELDKKRINRKFLPVIKIPKNIKITSDINELKDADLIIISVPSIYLRSVLKRINKNDLKNKVIISAVKGIEDKSLLRMSQVITQELGKIKLAVLSGPTIAHEVANSIPTTAVIATKNSRLSRILQNVLTTKRFRIYTNSDIIGVELGGSLKNVIAIACGISDGLNFGTNTKAAILSRGLKEIIRLGKKLGAKEKTFSGITGLGDLVTTCISAFSRNRQVGFQLGRGLKMHQIMKNMEMVAEGVFTVKAANALSRKYKIEMPITNQIYNVIYKNKRSINAVNELMTRSKKQEH